MSGWLQLAGYIVCIWILVNVVFGLLVIWNSRLDSKEVREFRRELDTWDSSLFLESADIRSEE